jgi:hypothetical protein
VRTKGKSSSSASVCDSSPDAFVLYLALLQVVWSVTSRANPSDRAVHTFRHEI